RAQVTKRSRPFLFGLLLARARIHDDNRDVRCIAPMWLFVSVAFCRVWSRPGDSDTPLIYETQRKCYRSDHLAWKALVPELPKVSSYYWRRVTQTRYCHSREEHQKCQCGPHEEECRPTCVDSFVISVASRSRGYFRGVA